MSASVLVLAYKRFLFQVRVFSLVWLVVFLLCCVCFQQTNIGKDFYGRLTRDELYFNQSGAMIVATLTGVVAAMRVTWPLGTCQPK